MAKYKRTTPGMHTISGMGLIPKLRDKYENLANKMILKTLAKHGFVKQKAADELGIKRTTLVAWCKRHRPELVG